MQLTSRVSVTLSQGVFALRSTNLFSRDKNRADKTLTGRRNRLFEYCESRISTDYKYYYGNCIFTNKRLFGLILLLFVIYL